MISLGKKERNMPVKTTGVEWNKFYHDPEFWGAEQWHDDTVIVVDGEVVEDYDMLHNDNAEVTIESGYVILSGDSNFESGLSLEDYFKKWKGKQTTMFLVVEFPKEKHAQVLASIHAAGGKCKN
jgi:hypothetical protein